MMPKDMSSIIKVIVPEVVEEIRDSDLVYR